MLRDAASKDRLEIGQIGDVDDLIDTLGERAYGIISGKTVTEQDSEMFAPLHVRLPAHLAKNRIRLKSGIFEVLVNYYDVVIVGLKLENNIFFEETEMHFVIEIDELRDDNFLILLVIDAHQRGVVAEVEKA